jgi:hypothetical protein
MTQQRSYAVGRAMDILQNLSLWTKHKT